MTLTYNTSCYAGGILRGCLLCFTLASSGMPLRRHESTIGTSFNSPESALKAGRDEARPYISKHNNGRPANYWSPDPFQSIFTSRLMGCDLAFGEQLHHRRVKGRQVLRTAAAHPVSIAHHLLVHPVTASVADVVLDGVVARQRAAFYEVGRNEQPGSMADYRDRLTT